MDYNSIQYKTCSRGIQCVHPDGPNLPITEFYKQKDGKYGVRGNCIFCVNKKKTEYNENNKDKIRKQKQESYKRNRGKILEYQKQYKVENKDYIQEYQRIYTETHKEEKSTYDIKYRKSIKEAVLNHYGSSCVCCKESNSLFLTVDHKNGGGRQHFKTVGQGTNFYKWIIKDDFPSDLQIMCYNCNCSRWYLGDCGHNTRYTPINKAAKYRIKLKNEVFNAYGGCTCACCGESILEFLTIDHVNNDGAEHRREEKSVSKDIYRWLKKNNYPDGFQILCYNCNCAKGHNNGVCPHKE